MKRVAINKAHPLLETDDYLRRVVECLVSEYQPEEIYLFGSKARGDERANSDYDLLVVVKHRPDWKEKKRVHKALWQAGLRKAMDIVLFSKEGFDARLEVKTSLPSTVCEEGKLLYAA
jgi:uncharacterized protein